MIAVLVFRGRRLVEPALQQAGFLFVADGTPDLSDRPGRSRAQARMLALTARIVSAHVARNRVELSALPSLIREVYSSLIQAGTSSAGPASPGRQAGSTGLVPAVPVERSVFPNYIVCLENGRKFRTLRRHLMAAFGLTPEAYRRRWGLPHDYPMIAPSYARNRSGVAKATGLGRTSRTAIKAACGNRHDS